MRRGSPWPAALLLVCLLAVSARAGAEQPDDDVDPNRPLADLPTYELPVPDLVPFFLPLMIPPPLGRAALSVVLSMRQADDRRDISGSLVVEFPFDATPSLGASASRSLPQSSKAKTTSGDKPGAWDADADALVQEDAEHESRERGAGGEPRRLPVVRAKDARAAALAASRHGHFDEQRDELDSLASRARYGSLLPTLRVRATRLVDESVSLSPTSYDAERTTSRGGASLWLEARATWNLDRLVFASEEVRVAQLQRDASEEQERASGKVVQQLFAWQRAVYGMFDNTQSPARCVELWIDSQELAASLDLATDGWFGLWSAKFGVLAPSCVDSFYDEVGDP